MPLISVIIPYYQQRHYIGEAIESLLAQTVADIEILAVDDASTDGSSEIVNDINDPRLVSIRRPANGGPSAALNDGLTRARGKYIALQGGDDVSEPWRLEHQLELLIRRDADLVFSEPKMIDAVGRHLRNDVLAVFFHYGRKDDSAAVLRRLAINGNYFCAPTAFFKSDLVAEIGLFDTKLIQLQDYDYWVRAAAAGKKIVVGQRKVTRYRWHGKNLSHMPNTERMNGEYLLCLRRLFCDTPARRLAEAFPDLIRLGRQEAGPLDRAMIALSMKNRISQSIGRSMLIDMVKQADATGAEPAIPYPRLAALLEADNRAVLELDLSATPKAHQPEQS